MKAHLVGSGIAALAAAAYLIKDGGVLGNNIKIYEAGSQPGGAMTMAGGPAAGYVLPTGRLFEKEYRCASGLFSLVPSASDPQRSIRDEIAAFNEQHGYYDKVHVIERGGDVFQAASFGLSTRDKLDLVKLALMPEPALEGTRISEHFSKEFFTTEFWFLWSPLMGCLPQHDAAEMRRFINRFLHLLPDLRTMTKILRTKFNQYQAITEPTVGWLQRQGVSIATDTVVTDVGFRPAQDEITANALHYVQDGSESVVTLAPEDLVLVTNGSQAADLAVGSMSEPPVLRLDGRSWALWKRLAQGREDFGSPQAFFGERHVPDTAWVTFTVTTTDPSFFAFMTERTGSEPGHGGLMTLKDSNWLVTLVIFHQPQFLDQPNDIMVWWGFAMEPLVPGNFVVKPMAQCSGEEILEEVICHLQLKDRRDPIMHGSICIPCLLPYAGSVWLPRRRTDRPQVVPKGSTNFGFIGQFAELPLEATFTMEYSIRSARSAVTTLRKLEAGPPPVYQGQYDIDALHQALKALT